MNDIGAQIKTIRRASNITQVQLSELAKITQTYLSQIEKGHKSPSMEVLSRIAKNLNVTVKLY